MQNATIPLASFAFVMGAAFWFATLNNSIHLRLSGIPPPVRSVKVSSGCQRFPQSPLLKRPRHQGTERSLKS